MVDFPVAFDLPESDDRRVLVAIKDAVHSTEHYCPGCNEVMIPVQGSILDWHFRHYSGRTECLDYRHNFFQQSILDFFNQAVDTNHWYGVVLPCVSCGNVREIDLPSTFGMWMGKERSVVPRTCSDLVIWNSEFRNEAGLIIEIVRSSPMSEQTRDFYSASGIPVFIVDVNSWSVEVPLIAGGFRVDGVLNYEMCLHCSDVAVEPVFSEAVSEPADFIESLVAGSVDMWDMHHKIEHSLFVNHHILEVPSPFSPILGDSDIALKLNYWKYCLIRFGFEEHDSGCSTLLYYPSGLCRVYADLDRLRLGPCLYVYPARSHLDDICDACLLDVVAKHLKVAFGFDCIIRPIDHLCSHSKVFPSWFGSD